MMATPHPAQRMTILIVDDNERLLDLFQDALTHLADLNIVTALDGVAGLEQYFTLDPPPACVVIDVKMPELDGYQLVRALRGDPRSAQTPLIILSALAQPRDQEIGLISGVDRYLRKPVMPSELIAIIQEVIAITAPQRHVRLQALAEEDTEGQS